MTLNLIPFEAYS